jgi:unsaturated rhamnogalacturonyl hydrolase
MTMKVLLLSSYSRRIWRIAVLSFAVALPIAAVAAPNQRPTPADVLSIMERVADWQLAHPSAHLTTDWTQAAGDAGMTALAGIASDPKYRDALLAMGEANGWKPGPRLYHADDLAIGQTYAGLYFLYRDPKMIAPLRSRLDAILSVPSNAESLDFHQPYDQASQLWSWCDSLFMAPPVWMQLFAATGDERYLDFAVKNWWRTTDYLYDPSEHLYFRDSTYFDRREANGKKIFWSRGNGWVMAGLVRILQLLPTNHPSRARFERLFREMAETILGDQQPDGLWRSSLLDPASYPLKESSGSGFYTYALAWGEEFATETATLPKLTQKELVTPSDEGLPPVANLLTITPAEAGKPFLYYLGAGWSKSGDFATETDWEDYVRQFVARLHAPLQVNLKNK